MSVFAYVDLKPDCVSYVLIKDSRTEIASNELGSLFSQEYLNSEKLQN